MSRLFKYIRPLRALLTYLPYSNDVPGYSAAFEWRDRCMRLERRDGTLVWMHEL